MQDTSVQLVGRRQMQALQAAQNAAAAMTGEADAQAALDPFSAIILAMMEGAQEQDGTPQPAPGKSQQDERTLAQNAAEVLLAGQAVPLNVELPQDAQQVQTGQAANVQALSAQMPAQAEALVQSGQTAVPVQTQPAADAAPAEQQGQAAQPQITFAAAMEQPQTGSEQSGMENSLLQHSDRQVFEQVRARQTQTEKKTEQTPDIDALQAQADARRPQVETQVRMQPVQQQKQESAESVSRQVTSQIQQNLERGSNEFTLRLKPESLGEVTVRLVEKAGKMTVQISAASQQTVKLLNGDLAALREAVRPMQVEVRDAVVETQSSDGSHLAQGFDMGGQFFGNSQQAFGQSQTAHSTGSDRWPLDDGAVLADEEQTAQAAQIVRENLLDVYL